MSTRSRYRSIVVCVVLGALVLPCGVFQNALRAQDTKKEQRAKRRQERKARKNAQQELPPEAQAMLEAGTPGKEHKVLAALVGAFDVAEKMWAAPGAPPVESKSTSTSKWILGKRFVQQTYRGSYMGMKFQGIGLNGYDKIAKRYTSLWMDSMSTNWMMSTGQIDDSGKVITYVGSYTEPDGKVKKLRSVLTIVSREKHLYSMHDITGDEAVKMMEFTYTRRAPKAKKSKAAKASTTE